VQIHDKVTTSLLAITAGVLNYVSKVLSQQSAAETRIYGLLEKQFVNDPTAMLIDTLLHNGRAATSWQLTTCLSQSSNHTRHCKTNGGSLSRQMRWFAVSPSTAIVTVLRLPLDCH